VPSTIIGNPDVQNQPAAYEPARIGIVSISDRATAGVYEDKGLPALKDWLERALHNALSFEARLIADEQGVIEETLIELAESCCLVLTTGGTGPGAT
jgi:molybdopterin adenylyltransferase